MKFTGKEIMDAFLLFLDDALPEFECKKIEIEGNSNCDRCDICMMKQYLSNFQQNTPTSIDGEMNMQILLLI